MADEQRQTVSEPIEEAPAASKDALVPPAATPAPAPISDDADLSLPGEHGIAEDDPTDAAADAAGAARAFFAEGVDAVREVGAARRAHAEAREQLQTLERTISDAEEELAHRRDVAERYEEIISQETARKTEAEGAAAAAKAEQESIGERIIALKDQLEQMKESDARVEKRLKAALDSAEAQENSAREQGARLQRRLDDAKRTLKRAETEHANGIAAAKKAIDSSTTRLATLREEHAEIQRNPSANSAAYSVRMQELETEIATAESELRRAQEDLPVITKELEDSLAQARTAASECAKPIDAAKKAFREVSKAADDARDAYQTAKKEAQERQRNQKGLISEQEKAKREQEEIEKSAAEEAEEAQLIIDEANDIHAHPEVTETIASRLEADRAEREAQEAEVSELAATERSVRERTRGSRLKLGAAIVAGIALIILIIVLVFVIL